MNANQKRCKIAHVIATSQYQGITIDGTLSLYKRTPSIIGFAKNDINMIVFQWNTLLLSPLV